MEVDSSNLLDQLTSPRQPSEEELIEAMTRTILRVLRHGDCQAKIFHDYFGQYPTEDLVHVLQDQFETMANAAFVQRLNSAYQTLIASEKIEIRGDRIRALYGHSLRGIIVGRMKWPEIPLFHATSQRHLDSILEHGLRPQGRTWVHLTSQTEYANRICKHHSFDGPAVMLQVDARRLKDHDVTFRQPNSHVWLANHVPPVGILVCEPNGHSEIDKRI